ncbi:hypothetical protein [Mesorhizobium sp.]|uniref:hypothetical protein n=1 Tax=Mesorhizobium sp. TaxID=1871066 RepID=UPI000FE3F4FB|nr:hypothetical protein [Mesorhizobium sp.]RWH69158.1 MAG: hypothetical protein EOQ84_23780 [Mesorhizobium sp.]RWL24470.1 MAG: hypothetical protein EOR63_30170 [Mesorhizobium sp.]RWL26931.1 MAG: hypothetical protein EOR58_16945 [Mesorhizobium sp.]RWL38056.1 MAG: hypothetical protein EOR59_15630 [Mesorhizobium sp.]RWL56842.1 MAG: hypothetical protein EOR62_05495 [Mesorhizobium sp.]
MADDVDVEILAKRDLGTEIEAANRFPKGRCIAARIIQMIKEDTREFVHVGEDPPVGPFRQPRNNIGDTHPSAA